MIKMRQIKFRCWDKIEKKYRFDSFLKTGDGRGDWILFLSDQLQPETPDKLSFSVNTVYPRDRFVLEEFTNIADKRGKEIYEGDILKSNQFNLKRIIRYLIVLTNLGYCCMPLIEFDSDFGNFQRNQIDNVEKWIHNGVEEAYPECIDFLYYYNEKGMIIGNRFENPDLLKLND